LQQRLLGGLLACLASLPWAPVAQAWGFAGHRLVTAKATRTLPPDLRPLFEGNTAWLAEHSIDPDLWRVTRPEEGPNHFLDCDAFGPYPFDAIPSNEAEHRARHGERALSKGRVPWRVAEAYRALVEAWRAGVPADVLRAAAALAHYVEDAHVPLHATDNYDGQLTGQKGLHARWEAELVERFERQLEPQVQPAAAARVEDATALIFARLRESFSAVAPLLQADLDCRGPRDYADTPQDDRYDDGYYTCFYAHEQARLAARLSAAAEALGNLWLSAWQDAGRPALDPNFRFAYVRGQTRAILVSLDGASAPVIDAAIARGVMPTLQRLRSEGASARGVVPSLPAKTAPGHAALFTGAWSHRNGVVANIQPTPTGSVLDSHSGFEATLLEAEPLWVSAVREGLNATVLTAPQSAPFKPYLDGKRFGANFGRGLTLVNGYQHALFPAALLTEKDAKPLADSAASGATDWPAARGARRLVSLALPGFTLIGALFDDPTDATVGFDSLALRTGSGSGPVVVLKPRPAGAERSALGRLVLVTPQGRAALFLRLFELSADGSRLRLWHGGAALARSNKPALEAALLEEDGGLVLNSAEEAYVSGALGPTLASGGDGQAEERYLETVALTLAQFGHLARVAATHARWDLLVAYVPMPDDFLTAWLGLLDANLRTHDAHLAARVQPYLDRALGLVDRYLAGLQALAGSDTILAVAADHGMAGVDHVLRPNALLQRAGLLALGADGRPDLTRTQALYFPGNAGFLLLNKAARPGGGVAPADEDALVARVRATLLAQRDEQGQPVVLDVLDARRDEHGSGLRSARGGDLYLSLAPGVALEATLGAAFERVPAFGAHVADPTRPAHQSAFALAGPGVARAADLGVLSAIDIAPTLCALLGLEPPAQAEGQVSAAALARGTSAGAPAPGAATGVRP
jgi:predicted AlkP superfamily phosphohydrolase/phosphomutase